MILGAPRVTLSALAELRQLLIGRGFRRSSVGDPTIVQQETRWRLDAGMKAQGRGGSAAERSDGCRAGGQISANTRTIFNARKEQLLAGAARFSPAAAAGRHAARPILP